MEKELILFKLERTIHIYDRKYPPVPKLPKNPSMEEAGIYYIIRMLHNFLINHHDNKIISVELVKNFMHKYKHVLHPCFTNKITQKLFDIQDIEIMYF